MNENKLDYLSLINQIKFHRENKKWFMYYFFKNLKFKEDLFNNLINSIDNIKIYFKNEKNIPRELVSILFEINSLYQSKIEDVALKKCKYNISENELFEYWEKLKFTTLDFFDDVYRN